MSPAGEIGRREAERSLALIRVVALPVIFVGERVVDAPAETSGAFPVVLAVTAVYAVGVLVFI